MAGKSYLSCIDVIQTHVLTQPMQHLVNADYARSIDGNVVFYTAEDPLTRDVHAVVRECIRNARYDGVIFFRMDQFINGGKFNFPALDELTDAGLEVHFARESLAIRNRADLLNFFPELYCFEVTQPRACAAILESVDSALASPGEQPSDMPAMERVGNHVWRRSTCRLCHSPDLELVLPLEPIPILSPNSRLDGRVESLESAPLELYACRSCGHVQQIYIVDPEVLYRRYLYTTSISLGLTEHFSTWITDLTRRIAASENALLVEIGSNNGAVLRLFKERGFTVLGVEPAQALAASATADNLPTIGDFFSAALARRIREAHGPARVVVANNVVANIDDLDDFALGVHTLLGPDGVFVMETQHALAIFERNLLDVIYHEHVSYFLVAPLERFFARHGLVLVDVEFSEAKGGSMRIFAQPAADGRSPGPNVEKAIAREKSAGIYGAELFSAYRNRVRSLRAEIDAFVAEQSANGKSIAAYGASIGCISLIEQFNLAHRIRFLVDDNATKEHVIASGIKIPVRPSSALVSEKIDWTILLAWRYASPITTRNTDYVSRGGRFAIPLPTFTTV